MRTNGRFAVGCSSEEHVVEQCRPGWSALALALLLVLTSGVGHAVSSDPPADADSTTVSDEVDSSDEPSDDGDGVHVSDDPPLTGHPGFAEPNQHDAPPAESLAPARPRAPLAPPEDSSQPATPAIEIKPAQFNGVQPGTTTRQQLQTQWGSPKRETPSKSQIQLHYDVEPFESVVVTLKGDVVDSVLINLIEPIAADRLSRELKLADIKPVMIRDHQGLPMGEAYPERGVVFSFTPEGARRRLAQQILLAPIDAQAFLLRAEDRIAEEPSGSLADLDFVLQATPSNAHALWLRAKLLADVGRFPKALRDLEQAVRVVGDNAEYRMALATVLSKIGQPEAAIEQAQQALELTSEGTLARAMALACQAEVMLYAVEQDYRRSAELHQQAIRIAGELADGNDPAVRRLASDALLKSHLALARDIAWGAWKSKTVAVPQWLQRAAAIAQKVNERGEGSGEELFLVAKEALAAYVGLQGELDPTPWMEEALTHGRKLIRKSKDPLWRSRWEWELGLALYDALQVYHMRKLYEPALKCGTLAVDYLERAGAERARQPGHAYMMGRLYFRIGSIFAIQYKDHAKAVAWFEKAVPLLEEPIPDSAFADVGRQGETFVSIAVSFWEMNHREEGIRLTKEGLRLMDQAVEEGILERSALLVPYGNLARMHQQIGDLEQARHYSDLAARLSGAKKR
jgi:tetratricopeptide (TPR) repeat protein